MKYDLRQCLRCEAVFLTPPPTKENELERAYEGEYYGSGESKFDGLVGLAIEYYRRRRARKVAALVQPRTAILDVGCADGRFLKYLIEAGFSCTGVEREGMAAERARGVSGLRLITSELGGLAESGEQFDAVTLWHVFEHLNETDALVKISKLVRKGGFLFVSLPNIDSFQSRIFRGRWFHLDPPRHLLFLPHRALVEELERLGLRHRRTTYFSLEYNPFGFQQSLLNIFVTRRDELFESLKSRMPGTRTQLGVRLQQCFFVLTFPLFACVAAIESLLQRGATMEIVFQRE